jgi:hypothetical protein
MADENKNNVWLVGVDSKWSMRADSKDNILYQREPILDKCLIDKFKADKSNEKAQG